MKRINYILSVFMILMAGASLFAGEAELKRPGQVTFFYPIGTNGIQSLKYSNFMSFNLLYGVNGGVDAFEFGGIGNYNAHNVKGIQIAGVFNINMEDTRGAQFAGISNTNFGNTSGLILSGTLNTVFGNTKGVMISNVNVTVGEMTGMQFGIVNYASQSKGLHIGFVNVVSEGKDSLPLGLISIVKDGYFAIELSAGEVLYGNLSYKMGVEHFYTIFKVGSSIMEGEDLWESGSYKKEDFIASYGFGWGSLIDLFANNRLALEASTNSIVYDNNWDEGTNLLNKLDLNYHIGMGPHTSLFLGPSFNVYVTEESGDADSGALPVPYRFFDEDYKNINVSIWIGANLGVTYQF